MKTTSGFLLPTLESISETLKNFLEFRTLSIFDNAYHYAELSPSQKDIPSDDLVAFPLKQAIEHLTDMQITMAFKTIQLIEWNQHHRFCGKCGSPTFLKTEHLERECQACHMIFYPRISPAIIVLIERDDSLLMARSPHFPPQAYGLIAGFVSPGETIEEAVHREVFEEVGIKIQNLRYMGSQSWPFPDLLMLGFMADYASGDIVIDRTEISEAAWYTCDALPGWPSSLKSIAATLIKTKISKKQTQNKHVETYKKE